MSFASSAPTRQPVCEPNEHSVNEIPRIEEPSSGVLLSLQLLWANRRTLFRAAICLLVLSTILAFLLPFRYESVVRLMPADNQPSSGIGMALAAISGATGSGGLGGIAADFLGVKGTSDVFVGILSSRTLQDRLVQRFGLCTLYGDSLLDDARKELAAHTSISIDRKSQIISIVVTDRSPQRAAAMAQAYAEELNHLVAELSTSSARRERIFLEDRLKTVMQDLEAAEQEFSQFASKNSTIDVKEQGKAMVEAAAALQGQLIAAQSQYQGLREIFTESSPRARSVKARIDELQRQLEKLGGRGDTTTLPADSLYPSIRSLPLLGVPYADLYRRAKIQEVVLETLTKQYELAKVQEAKEIPTVKVLDTANVPERKSFPPRLAISASGAVLGLMVSAGWILGGKMWHGVDSSDPRKVLVLDVASTVSARIRPLRFMGLERGNGEVRTQIHRSELIGEVAETEQSSEDLK